MALLALRYLLVSSRYRLSLHQLSHSPLSASGSVHPVVFIHTLKQTSITRFFSTPNTSMFPSFLFLYSHPLHIPYWLIESN